MFSFTAMQAPLSDITNQADTQPLNNTQKKGRDCCVRWGNLIMVVTWRSKKIGIQFWSLLNRQLRRRKELVHWVVGTRKILRWWLVSNTTSHNELP